MHLIGRTAILLPSCAVLALSLSYPLLAGELRLSNGDRISGEPTGLENGELLFASTHGAVLKVPLDEIVKLTTTEPVVLILSNGDRLVGKLSWESKGARLRSVRFGDVRVETTEVVDIRLQGMPATSGSPAGYGQSADRRLSDAELMAQGRGTGHSRSWGQVSQAPAIPETPDSAPAPQSGGSRPQTVGQPSQEDEDPNLNRVFLREATVLLAPGEIDTELAFSYARDEAGAETNRDLRIGPSVRIGILDRLEGFFDVALAYADREIVTGFGTLGGEETGISDVVAGLKYLLVREDENWPDIVLAGSVTFPTADEPQIGNPNRVALGGGRWRLSGAATFIRSYDPAVLFGSVGYTHSFKDTLGGIDIEGGQSINYSFGAGFAINNQISLSGQFFGAYQTEIKLNGEEIDGSNREPMALRSSLTYRISDGQYLEPAVTYGLNDSAPDVILQLSYSHRF